MRTRFLDHLLISGIELRNEPGIHARALHLASHLGQMTVYDAQYLAPADILGYDFWTADERFYRAALPVCQNVYWTGEFSAPSYG